MTNYVAALGEVYDYLGVHPVLDGDSIRRWHHRQLSEAHADAEALKARAERIAANGPWFEGDEIPGDVDHVVDCDGDHWYRRGIFWTMGGAVGAATPAADVLKYSPVRRAD